MTFAIEDSSATWSQNVGAPSKSLSSPGHVLPSYWGPGFPVASNEPLLVGTGGENERTLPMFEMTP